MIALGSKLKLLALAVMLVAAGCSSSPAELDSEAARQFDIANNLIADLTTEGSERVPRDSLTQSALRAQTAGTSLRVVVSAAEGDLVRAEAVVDRYGGTAISYQADRTTFEGASHDMSAGQLTRAIDAARSELDIGESAAAFVNVLETEGLESPGRSIGRTLVLIVLVLAALFMLANAWSFWKARQRRLRRRANFEERKMVLSDWAAQLTPQVESMESAVAEGTDSQRVTHGEAKDFVVGIGAKVDAASSIGELDAAEMRIGRVAIKLRDLQRSLDDHSRRH